MADRKRILWGITDDEERLFLSKMCDIAEKSEVSHKVMFSRFLNPGERMLVESRMKDDFSFSCDVEENNLLEIAYQNQSAVYATTQQVNVVASAEDTNAYEIYGFGVFDLHVVSHKKARVTIDGKEIAQMAVKEQIISIKLNGKSTLRLQRD